MSPDLVIPDLLDALARANLVGGAAVLAVLAARKAVRPVLGAQLAYGLWLVPVVLAAASIVPPASAELAAAAPVVVAAAPTWKIETAQIVPGDVRPAVIAVWLGCALVFAGLLATRQFRFLSRLERAQPMAADGVRLMRAARADVGPALVGSVIVVPSDFDIRFSPDEQAAILAHERAHLARGDILANALIAAVQCLCWFNPLVHVAAFQMRLDQELACDATVLRSHPGLRRSYAQALLKSQVACTVPPVGCTWPARAQHPLKERIAMLKRSPPTPMRRWTGALLLAAVLAGGGYAAWASQPSHVITKPDWVQRPTGADLVRFYPAEAVKQKLPGDATMECRVETTGLLSGCHVLRQSPEGAGFGDAALKMTDLFRMKPKTRDGRPVAGGVVRIPVAFRIARPTPIPPQP